MTTLEKVLAVTLGVTFAAILGVGAVYVPKYNHVVAENAKLVEASKQELATRALLIDEVNKANEKFADADLKRQFAEEGEARWQRAILPLYTPDIIRRLKPAPLPDGTSRIGYPNPYDVPYLVQQRCADTY